MLQACAKVGVGKALQSSSADAFACIAQLLSGRQVAAAAVLAASAGNVRLASLIAQVCRLAPCLPVCLCYEPCFSACACPTASLPAWDRANCTLCIAASQNTAIVIHSELVQLGVPGLALKQHVCILTSDSTHYMPLHEHTLPFLCSTGSWCRTPALISNCSFCQS